MGLIPHLLHTWPLVNLHSPNVSGDIWERRIVSHLDVLKCKLKQKTETAPSVRYHVGFLFATVHPDWIYSLSLVRKYWSDVNDDLCNVFNTANMWQIETKQASSIVMTTVQLCFNYTTHREKTVSSHIELIILKPNIWLDCHEWI